jgi:hypothetical protein
MVVEGVAYQQEVKLFLGWLEKGSIPFVGKDAARVLTPSGDITGDIGVIVEVLYQIVRGQLFESSDVEGNWGVVSVILGIDAIVWEVLFPGGRPDVMQVGQVVRVLFLESRKESLESGE